MPICRAAAVCIVALLSTVLVAQSSAGAATPPQSSGANQGNPQSPTAPIGSPPQNSPEAKPGVGTSSTANPTTDSTLNGGVTSTAPATAAQTSAADQVSANTEFHAALDTPLSTKTSKEGDRFTATVVDSVRGTSGSIVIPAGSRLEGEVAAATEEEGASAALRGRGTLSLRFRDLVLPSGQTVPLNATLVSVNNTNGRNTRKTDEEAQIQSGTQGKDTARDMGTGGRAGSSLVFGGPLKGFAIAAMAGGGHILTTNGKEVELPAQIGMVIRLNQPIIANGY